MVTKIFYHVNGKNYDAYSGDRSSLPVDGAFIIIFLDDNELIANEYKVGFIERVVRFPDRVPSLESGWSISFRYPSVRFGEQFPHKKENISDCFELIKRDYPEDFLALSFHHEVFNGRFFLTRGEQ